MPRQLSPREAARRLEKWANAGIDVALVDGLLSGLEADKSESRGRIHSRTGNLASTVRVARPSSTKAARTGKITASLSAGTKKGGKAPYGRILQEGGTIRPHAIVPRQALVLAFQGAGELIFAKRVQHPGATFSAQNYLRVNEPRLAGALDDVIQRSADREIG